MAAVTTTIVRSNGKHPQTTPKGDVSNWRWRQLL